MRMFVINLARAKDRRQRMSQQFAKLGLKPEFHEAVDGSKLTAEHYAEVDRRSASAWVLGRRQTDRSRTG